jgi:hypothetical protein
VGRRRVAPTPVVHRPGGLTLDFTSPDNPDPAPGWQEDPHPEVRVGADFFSGQVTGMPPIGGQDQLTVADQVAHAHYYQGDTNWWVTDLDRGTGDARAVVRRGDNEPEFTSINLGELANSRAVTQIPGGVSEWVHRSQRQPTPLGAIPELAEWASSPSPVSADDRLISAKPQELAEQARRGKRRRPPS